IVGHSVDIDKNCQRVLCSNEDGALHVFPDLLQLLTLDARVAVLKVMDTSSLELKPLIAKYKAMPKMPQPDDIKKVINQLGSTLLDKLMARMDAFENLFVEQATCCKHHSKKCDVFPAALLQTDSERVAQVTGVAKLTDPLLIYMAGTSCQDWSSMSQVLSLAGKTVLPFAVELQLIRRKRPHVYFHECTRNFRASILEKFLPGYRVHSMIQRPTERGFPIQRTRRYTACIRLDMELVRPIEEIKILDR
ncbi:unnamed protein product, partial [Effrenium voratum]